MTWIIDGHNLIGVLPNIHLGDPDDELRLLERLRSYRLRTGERPMIVFFDSGDLPASGRDLSSSGLQVRFSEPGQSADDAILAFLASRAQPGQYAVVTNDHGLQYRVRMAGASTLPASTFAPRLAVPKHKAQAPPPQGPDPHDPTFADIYSGFLETDRDTVKFVRRPEGKIDLWIEQLYGDDLEGAEHAARWLGRFGGAPALAALRDALTHDDGRVRAAALLGLGDLADPAALPDLCDRLLHDPASMAREAAAQSLARIGDRSVEAALETAAGSDTKSKIRKAARSALLQIRARRG